MESLKNLHITEWHVRRYLKLLFLGFCYLFVVCIFLAVLFVYFYPVGSFFDESIHQSTKILDRNGVVLYESLNENAGRTEFVPLADISSHLINATIATEDSSFYKNSGVDVLATLRAAFTNAQSGKVVSGASTITQQVVRNVLGTDRKRTLVNKIQEAFFALRVAKKFDKEKILEFYLNKVYYGNLNYGVAAASHTYFGKQPRDLDIAESAFLAGLPQSPSRFDPFKNLDRAVARQKIVLERMLTEKLISHEEFTQAVNEELVIEPRSVAIRAPHFVHYIIDQLEDRYGADFGSQGLEVTTTVDVYLNDAVTKLAQSQVALVSSKNVTNAAVVVLDVSTGEIRAMVGSVDYFDDSIGGRNNMALANRQPGSAMKPITYAAAFEKGWFGGTIVKDEPVRFFTAEGNPYYPQNYDFEFHGDVTVREALANSYNIPAVKAIEFAGVEPVLTKAHEMGITTLNESADHYGLALTLGDGEVKLLDLTAVYETLASGGLRRNPISILQVRNSKGEVLYAAPEKKLEAEKRVLGQDVAFMLTDIMSDNNERIAQFGLNNVLTLDRPAAVKTGTTRNFKDNWTMGFTPDYVVGVWVGNSNGDPMHDVSGVQGAGPIWHSVMNEVHRGIPIHPFVPPASVVKDENEWRSRTIQYSAESGGEVGEFRIKKPFDGDIFQFQKTLDTSVQRIRLESTPLKTGETIEWFVDGEMVGNGESVFWPISIGEHSVKAVKRGLDAMLKESQIKVRVEE